ncbi:MAG: 2-keto-4-pentenoate hydratase [Betaproteobacteria bacterium]
MTDTVTAARLLLDARRMGKHVISLPDSARPASEAESYAIQDAQMRTLGPIGGWKVGARSPDAEPNCGPLPASLVLPSPQVFSAGRFPLQLVEAELAFKLARDLPPRTAPYTEQDVVAAIASVHATIEVLDSRYENFRKIDGPSLLADFSSNGALVVGPGRTSDVRVDQTQAALAIYFDERLELTITGGNTAGDVFRLLVWLANHAANRSGSGGLRAGQVITTGSCIGARPAPPGTRVRAVFAGIDNVEATV